MLQVMKFVVTRRALPGWRVASFLGRSAAVEGALTDHAARIRLSTEIGADGKLSR